MMPPLWVWLFFLPTCLKAMLIGNPAEPALKTSGIFSSPHSWCNIRVSFLKDYVYYQKYQDEFTLAGVDAPKTFIKLNTNAWMATLHFENRVDFYGILGASNLQLNQEIYSKMQFCWGFGGKIILYRTENFFIGTDIKYFDTSQQPLYCLSEGLPFNFTHNFTLKYQETQLSLGASYRSSMIAPYICVTYLISKIEPNPMTALVRWPMDTAILVDAECKFLVTQYRWGIALGSTLIGSEKATLTVESRLFSQNAIDVNINVQF